MKKPARPKPPTKSKGKSKSEPRKPRGPREAKLGDNTLEGRAQPYLRRIEGKLDDLESERSQYMLACKPIHEDIREIYGEAKENGIPVKALKGLVKYRELEKKQAKIADDFEDIDEAAQYSQLIETLGPLGFAAAQRAGFARNENEAERDVRPRHMTQPGAQADAPGNGADAPPRADEAELARVGRGHDPEPAPAASPPADDGEPQQTTH